MKNFYAAYFKRNANAFCLSMALLFTFMGVTPGHLFAQTPTVSYPSQTAYIGIPVQLAPTASGVAAPGYGSATVAGYLTNAYGVAYDQHGGNIYTSGYTEFETQFGLEPGHTLYRVPQDGTGRGVQVGNLTNASGVAADKSGNVWVSDVIAKAVYKVPYGSNTMTMVASGFNNPQGLAVDASGNVYVADRGYAALEKIPAAGGAWTTVISGLSGTNAVTLDAAGNIFIAADGGVYRVPAGGSSASLYFSSIAPVGVAVDPSGSLYVADANAQRITKLQATGGTVVFPVDQANCVALDPSGAVYCGRGNGGYINEYKLTGGYYLATPLPPGLSFSNSTGVVSGTPTIVTAAQSYQVYAYNATGATPTGFGLAVANPPLPVISYASPQTYTPGAAIAPLAPASNYVAPPAYKGNPVTVGSGIVNPVGVATDSQGNVYIADDAASVNGTSGRVYMEAASGGGQSILVDNLSDPTNVATDAAGDLYISDTGLIQILEVPAGTSNATNESPELSAIGPVASDGAGNVYTFAPGDHTIYKLPSDLSGESAFASGLNSPAGIAADVAGNVYVSDAGNNNIVKFNPDGSSAGVLASVQNPGPITVDAGGNLYVVNTSGNLYTITTGTTTALQIGSGLTNASSLAIDGKGNIYYTDINNLAVKKISPSGGYFLSSPLPLGLTFSNTTGIISGTPTAANAGNYGITAYNITGGTTANLNLGIITLAVSYNGPDTYTLGAAITPLAPAGSGVAAPGYSSSPVAIGAGFKFPTGVAVDAAGNVYVADENKNAVYKIPVAGGGPVPVGSGFISPNGVAVDAAGNVFIADGGNNAVKEIPEGTRTIVTLGSGFQNPVSVAVDAADNVYVADFGNSAIKKIPAGGGAPITLAAISTNTQGVAVDAAGNVYFGTVFGNQVKMIPAGGGALVTLGSGFTQPRGIEIDAAGNLYVADSGNNAIKELPAGGGAVITLGSGFSSPEGVAIDAAGNIYVGDAANAAVKKIKPVGGYFINPVLPAGLSFDKSTGIISGIPSVLTPATNYTVFAYNSSSSGTAVVNIETVLPQTITFNGLPAKTYGDADFAPGATSTSGGSPAITYTSDNTAVATIVAGNIHITGAGTANITASQAGDGTHAAATDVVQPLTVSQKLLTITANNQTMTRGQAVPTLTVTYSGFVNGDNSASLTTLPSITTTGTSSSPPGTYTITASGAASANYSISYVDGTLNITPPSSVATLWGLLVSAGTLSPDFASSTTAYTVAVANDVTSIAVTPIPNNLNAAITVNGAAVPGATRSGEINLAVGANTITIVVVAEDGVTTLKYTIIVTRAASADANISALTLSSGTLTPAFSPGTTGYTATVPNSVSTLKLTPAVDDANATVTVNGTAVSSGAASSAIALNVGTNTITTIVTAQDGTTTQTYTVTVTRLVSANDNLVSINPSVVPISPAFSPATLNYTLSVSNSTASITVRPTTSDANAAIKLNGTTIASKTTSPPIALAEGAQTPITMMVTAPDGTTSKTYTLTVTRAPSANDTLSNITLSKGTLSPAFLGGTTTYAASVPNTTTSITLTPATADANAIVKVNGISVSPGTASGAVALNVGANTITVAVTAQDGSTTQTYTLTVTRTASANANLASMNPSVTPLSPAFSPATTSYTLNVSNATATMTVKPVTSDVNATIKVNGTSLAPGTVSAPVSLNEGSTTPINVLVTAADGTTTKTYTIAVSRAPSADATLSNIALSGGTLSPAFAAATTSYTATVPNTTSNVTVTPTVTDANATLKVNGTAVASGMASHAIALAVGVNNINIVVTAQNGSTTKTYTVTVTRIGASNANLTAISPSVTPLSPAFSSSTTSYTINAANTAATMTVNPVTADPNATIKVNGTTVVSGTVSQAIALAEGAATSINIVVTAQDGTTTKTYTINVTRAPSADATLSNISLNNGTLSPVFATATTSYTASVPNSTSAITLTPVSTDAHATIKVNGTTVASGTASGAIPLNVGNNIITTIVTAQNGTTTKTYTLTVTRALSPDASLSGIQISAGTLSPVFATFTTSYTASVPNTTASITLVATTTNANATVKVNGIAVSSGTASGPIALNVGQNTVAILVTAQDGVSTETYSVTVTRVASANANLASINPSATPLSPAFAPATTSYTISVANSVSTMTVRPVTGDANATMKVNGISLASGTTSIPNALLVGSNTINIAVTAQNGTTIKTYTITVTRAPGGADSYNPGISVSKPTETPLLAEDGILVHQGLSPNGDGLNDFLQIDNISQYPDNKLTIMNRNGQLVYEAKGYDNSSKIFDGHSNKNGQMQLPGTYFYQLDYNIDGITKHKTGFIVLKY